MQNPQFDIHTFRKYLSTQWLGQELIFESKMVSTNTFAKEYNKGTVCHGTVVFTDDQTAGRGQYERVWISEAGKNLTLSMILEPGKKDALTIFTLACALSVSQMLQSECKIRTMIKWPNDVVIGSNKIAGLLTETQFNGRELSRLIVGIGLNVNQKKFPDVIGGATSCMLETGLEWSRERLLATLLSRIEYNYLLWQKGSEDLLSSINQLLEGHGKWVNLIVNGKRLNDKFKLIGVSKNGVLQALDKEMNVHTYDHEQVRIDV